MSYSIRKAFNETEWTDTGPKYHWTFEFDFQTKEEYLVETGIWKRKYAELSEEIRKRKLWRKPKHRPADVSGWQNDVKLGMLRHDANQMCQMRVQAKAEAGRQMRQRMAA